MEVLGPDRKLFCTETMGPSSTLPHQLTSNSLLSSCCTEIVQIYRSILLTPYCSGQRETFETARSSAYLKLWSDHNTSVTPKKPTPNRSLTDSWPFKVMYHFVWSGAIWCRSRRCDGVYPAMKHCIPKWILASHPGSSMSKPGQKQVARHQTKVANVSPNFK